MVETSCLNVVICDDELQICRLMQRKLLEYGMRKDVEIKTEIFTDSRQLLKSVNEKTDVNIIFLSGHSEYVFESFRVQAFRYLLKPLKDADLEEAMDGLFANREAGSCLEYRFQGENFRIPYRDILYLEGMRGKIWVYCINGKVYRWRGAMAVLADDLKQHGFVMTHQSYIVNINRIVKFNYKEVELEGSVKVPVSKLRLNDLKKEYINRMTGGS